MIKDNSRLIIICGMAHTGTTIVADVLRQHPDNLIIKNGAMHWLLENDYLLEADTVGIESLLLVNKKRIILKRPWVEHLHTEWLISELPNAYYLYCKKNKEKTINSWSRSNSYVESELRNSTLKEKYDYYDDCCRSASKLQKNVERFHIVNNEEVIKNPISVFSGINNFLNQEKFDYDLSEISSSKSIKKKFKTRHKKRKSIKHYFNLFLMKIKANLINTLKKLNVID